MGRPANTAERRQQIVGGLMKLIARKGYAGASIQDIAREAGLASGLVHYHFESKQEILLTLFAQLEDLVKQRLDARLAALPAAGDPRAALDALIDAFLAIDEKADQRAVLCWTMISAEAIVMLQKYRWTGNVRVLTVIVPALLRATPPLSTNPMRHGILPGLASRSMPMSAAYPSA